MLYEQGVGSKKIQKRKLPGAKKCLKKKKAAKIKGERNVEEKEKKTFFDLQISVRRGIG